MWAGILGTALIYFAAAKLGLRFAFVAKQVTVVWPPTGIALAALLVLGPRAWPGITLGAFLANATTDEPLWTAGGIAVGNTLEAVAGGRPPSCPCSCSPDGWGSVSGTILSPTRSSPWSSGRRCASGRSGRRR